MPGFVRGHSGGRMVPECTSADARVARAVNDAMMRGLAAGDEANLAALLTEHFGQDRDDIIPDNDVSYDESDSEMDIDLGNDEEEEDMDMMELEDDDGFQLVVPNLADEVLERVGVEDWSSEANDEELLRLENFSKCTCTKRASSCIKQFDPAFVLRLRAQMMDGALSTEERKMFIMGRVSATIQCGETTQCSKRGEQKDRQRARVSYLVEGKRVCRATFRFLHSVGDTQLRNITKNYLEKGVVPPKKASGGIKSNKTALSSEDINRIVTYITNFAESQGLVIPGRISGVKSSDPRIRLLPTSQTKASVWRSYEDDLANENDQRAAKGLPIFRSAKQRTFLNVWNQYCPFVITSRPKTDLCWQCQKNNSAVYQSANLTEEEKLDRISTQKEHLAHVAAERNLYRDMVKDAQAAIKEGREDEMHYSFDFAQQMQFPTDPDQPGPMYFLCPRKCGLFGVTCDGTNQQVNYLIDEGMACSKGSNSVISYLHDYFNNFGVGEQVLQLHCDNCGGQNKNKFVMWYLAWRTLHGLHDEIGVHFMVSGHTKFSPDRGFGLIKHRYKRTLVSSLDDISDVVTQSSVNGHNIPRLVGREDGTVMVPSYDWQKFLSPFFHPLTGIKKYHHIRFHCDHPGVAFVKVLPSDEEKRIQLLRSPSRLPPRELPEAVPPPRLTRARSTYLHNTIREFCTASTRDIVCPAPEQDPPTESDAESSSSED